MKIIVYTRPTCSCIATKEFLTKKGVAYTDINVEEDRTEADKIFHKVGQSVVPIIEINGKTIIGFDKDELKKEIAAGK